MLYLCLAATALVGQPAAMRQAVAPRVSQLAMRDYYSVSPRPGGGGACARGRQEAVWI